MDRKIYTSEIKQIGNEEDRTLRFTTSTESIDRDGDIIRVDGWKLDNYLKNPVILYGHNYGGLPVGRSVNIQKDSINKKLVQDVQFPTKDEYDFADTVYRLAKGGYLNATSVGFIGIRKEPRLDEEGEYLGNDFKEQELLETSIVPVPSNPTALMEARSKGIIDEKELKILKDTKGDVEMEEKKEDIVEEKSGATLSSKTIETLSSAINQIKLGLESISGLISTDDGEERKIEPSGLKVKLEMSDELKQAFEDIKKEIESSKEVKEEPKVEIDLDSIEFPKAEKDAAKDELNIKPEELKSMMKEIIQETIQGGN